MESVTNTLYSFERIGIFIQTGALIRDVTIYVLP